MGALGWGTGARPHTGQLRQTHPHTDLAGRPSQPAPPAEPHTRAQAMPVPKPRVLCPQEMATVLCAREGGAHVHAQHLLLSAPGTRAPHAPQGTRPEEPRTGC